MRALKLWQKALLWALVSTAVSSVLFVPLSFGIAHGSALKIFYLGGIYAIEHELPGADSLVALFFYQLAYYVGCALLVAGLVGLIRAREQRLKAERERANAS
jgi:hypothetical protein